MGWMAPAPGIAMCQSVVVIFNHEQKEPPTPSAFGVTPYVQRGTENTGFMSIGWRGYSVPPDLATLDRLRSSIFLQGARRLFAAMAPVPARVQARHPSARTCMPSISYYISLLLLNIVNRPFRNTARLLGRRLVARLQRPAWAAKKPI